MATKLFVGGLAYKITDDHQLRDLFAPFGTVQSAQVIVDKFSNQSKGFGFVEMPNDEEAKAAIAALDGKEVEGRSIAVNEARPQERREPRMFGSDGNARSRDNRRNDNRGGGGRRY